VNQNDSNPGTNGYFSARAEHGVSHKMNLLSTPKIRQEPGYPHPLRTCSFPS